jgi:DNA-binding NarL/FixJ family response regulator
MNNPNINSLDILLVDDNEKYIEVIKLLIQENPIINKIYEATCGKTALEIIKEKKIDIVITDFNMPGMTGLELLRIIKLKYPYIKIIVLTMEGSISLFREIIKSEAEGYILKDTNNIELDKAIYEIANGGKYYNREIV